MENSSLLVELEKGRLTITLNRPDAANALSPGMVERFIDALQSDRPEVCVVRGEGRNFCAGFDLSDIDKLSDGDLLWRFLRIETLLQMVHHASFPTIALVQGHVVGAGADLFAACSHRIAAPDARFKMPGWNFELALGTRRLAGLIGTDAARDMLIDTKTVLADDAERLGLASAISKPEEWDATLEKLHRRSVTLPEFSRSHLMGLTGSDGRDADMAAVVRTAGRPGLKRRIQAYQQKVADERETRRKREGQA